jgi:Tfp pilus assembly protein PilN
MRPVNLIPPDERRGDSAPLRTGSLIYVLLAGLGLLLLGIVVVALTSKQISDRTSEKSSLERQLASATQRANSVQAFTEFRTVQQNRAATVTSLAQSRFDWQRVLQELARVLPADVTICSLTGTVSQNVTMDSGGSSSCSSGSSGGTSLRDQVAGPVLEIDGCASSQDAVAGFVAALQDIDGVTRVGLEHSGASQQQSGAGLTGEPGDASLSGSNGCQKPYGFTIFAAFDAVPAPGTTPPPPATPPTPSGTDATTSNNQVSDGQSQENVARASVNAQSSKANQAVHTVLRGGN